MTELARRVTAAVEEAVKPHRDIYGDDAPVVRMALRILEDVKRIEAELGEEMVSTERAAEITGWHPATLQARARNILAGEEVAPEWFGLQVERTASGYLFQLGTIPKKAA